MSEFLLSFRYAALEDNMEREREETQVEMKRRNDTIRALSKDLEDSKSLIKTLEQRGLTEEGIARLSPAAAAASKLINSGMSLTDVYSQVCQDVRQNFVDCLIWGTMHSKLVRSGVTSIFQQKNFKPWCCFPS